MLSNASNAAGKAHEGRGRVHVARLCAAAAFALGFTFAAQPASADNAFKYAFKDEIGRIVAHRVAEIAPHVLLGPVVHQVRRVSHYETTRHNQPRHYDRGYRDYDRGYRDYDRGYRDYDRGYRDYDRGYKGHHGKRSSSYYYDRPHRGHAKHHRKHYRKHRGKHHRSCGHRSHH